MVYFDVGGTLLEAHPSVGAVYAKAGAVFGLRAAPEQLEQAFREAWPRHTASFGRLSFGTDDAQTREWWRGIVFEVLRQVGFDGELEPVFDACYRAFSEPRAWRIYDDVLPTLEAMRARGVRLGILSNWDLRLPPLLDALDLSRWFEPILVSAMEGVEKPDPRIFSLACARAGLPPASVMYVGDQLRIDVLPARELGITAYLIDRKNRRPADEPGVVRRLDQLLARL